MTFDLLCRLPLAASDTFGYTLFLVRRQTMTQTIAGINPMHPLHYPLSHTHTFRCGTTYKDSSIPNSRLKHTNSHKVRRNFTVKVKVQ